MDNEDEQDILQYRPRGRRNVISVEGGGRTYTASLGGTAAEQSAERAIALYRALQEEQTNEDTLRCLHCAHDILELAKVRLYAQRMKRSWLSELSFVDLQDERDTVEAIWSDHPT